MQSASGEIGMAGGCALVAFTDYSRWERRPSKPPRPLVRSPASRPHARAPGLGLVLAPPCTHGHGIGHRLSVMATQASLQPKTSPKRVSRIPEPPSIRLLKLQIATKRSSRDEYHKYKEDLSSNNVALITSILQVEDRTHTSVRDLLEKYQKFKGALATLGQRSTRELASARAELEATQEKLHHEIEGLRQQVGQTEATLQTKSQQLQVLLHYKEKEYPVKVVRTEQLKEQIELLTERNKIELAEVESEIAEERGKCEQQMQTTRLKLESHATEASIASIRRSVQEKAIQNRIMEKEIVIHEKKLKELKEGVRALKSRIRLLRQKLKESEAKVQPLQALGKCLPNTELQLNIPLQHHLPV